MPSRAGMKNCRRFLVAPLQRGRAGLSDASALSLPLLQALPQHCLLILDRLYGYAAVIDTLQQQCDTDRAQHYLVRVKDKLAAAVRTPLGDEGFLTVSGEVKLQQRSERDGLDQLSGGPLSPSTPVFLTPFRPDRKSVV